MAAASERRPADRTYAAVQWSLISVCAAIILYGMVFARHVPAPRPVGFRLVMVLLLCFNALWWSVADRRFARHVRRRRLSSSLRFSAAVFTVALNAPICYMLWTGWSATFASAPTWYAAAVTLWQIGLAVCLPIITAVRLLGLGLWAAARRLLRDPACADSTQTGDDRMSAGPGIDLGRRAVLKTAFATAPMLALVGGTAAGRWREGRFLVRRHTLPAPWLPDRLRGLTITHISDLHLGRLYRPSMLPRLVEEANRLDGDIVVVTGDIVDNSNDLLPAGLEAIAQLTHRHGVFLCIGNHDEIDDREEFIRIVQAQLPLLVNERRRLAIGGEAVTIAGLDYGRRAESTVTRRGDVENAALTLAGHDLEADGPVIALAHHPHTWDALVKREVPLTLSGHTHGGQVMFTPPNERPDLGIGRILFRYVRGFYRDGPSTLFVNTGVGNWFPVRINAPAEICQIRLV